MEEEEKIGLDMHGEYMAAVETIWNEVDREILSVNCSLNALNVSPPLWPVLSYLFLFFLIYLI